MNMFIIKKAAAQGFALGFAAVGVPLAAGISAMGRSDSLGHWLVTLVSAVVGGLVPAGMSRRRSPRGSGRGLLLGLIAWSITLTVWFLLAGPFIFLWWFYLILFCVAGGGLLGAVGGRLLGPPPPDPCLEAQRRLDNRRRQTLLAGRNPRIL